MTARHIDATDKTDGSHVVKILWNENDGERELTVRMPAAGTDATDRVDVDLLPVPEEDPATTMDDAVAALEGFLGNNKYIHIDDDVRSVCAGALTTVIRVESGSSTGIVEGLHGRFHDSSVASDEVTGAIIAIEGPKSLQLSDATAIVGGVQKRLTDKVEIIWVLEFHRRGRPARHRTPACNTTEIRNTTGLHAGKSNIIGMPVALTSTSSTLTAGFHVTGASFIRLSASTRPARSGNSGRTPLWFCLINGCYPISCCGICAR